MGDYTDHDHQIDLLIQKLNDMIQELAAMKSSAGRCSYTFAHTRHWCGYPECRDS